MAGLQYNFFPTDFFYPRPAQSKPGDSSSSTALTLQTQSQNRDVVDIDSRRQQQPGNIVRQDNKNSVSMRQGDKPAARNIFMQNREKHVKLPQNSLSWLVLIPEEFSDSY